MLTALAIEGYRSIRDLVLPLAPLTIVTGANGAGKSSLARSLRLLAAVGRDGAIAALAAEGGLPSVLWAGPEQGSRGGAQGTIRRRPVALRLGFAGDEFGYAIDFGLPVPSDTAFARDPEIKTEAVWSGPLLRPATLLSERRGPRVRHRSDGGWTPFPSAIPGWRSMLDAAADFDRAPELVALRESLRGWRFYDAIRTDAGAPARRVEIGTRTPVLASDARDLAAALQTIREQGGGRALDAAVDAALPGSRVRIEVRDGRFALLLEQPGVLRPLEAAELSDGTLRYLVWVAALLSERPAELLVLNEPETSLHPSLVEPLAGLLRRAAERAQVIVVTHSAALVAALGDALVHELVKSDGETRLAGQGMLDSPAWRWPER